MLLLLACTPAPEIEKPVADTADTAVTTDTAPPADTSLPEDTAPDDGLVGTPLDPPLDPPTFVVENQRGETRSPEWLAGDPTVLWFFRDAGST